MTAGKYTCDECKYTNGWHVVDDSDPTKEPVQIRCPNRKITEAEQAAREYAEGNTTAAKEAAHRVVADAAETMPLLNANTLAKAFDDARVPPGLRPGAFTWAKNEGLIEKTGTRVMRTEDSIRHPVEQWRSLAYRQSGRAS